MSIGRVTRSHIVRIPAQEAYLNERNLRLLATLREPLKAKVDRTDDAVQTRERKPDGRLLRNHRTKIEVVTALIALNPHARGSLATEKLRCNFVVGIDLFGNRFPKDRNLPPVTFD
jgi:hypothetical protein